VLALGPWIVLGTIWAVLLGLAFAWSLKRFAGATVIETNLPDEAVEALRAHAAA
jgi:hypothetical protein